MSALSTGSSSRLYLDLDIPPVAEMKVTYTHKKDIKKHIPYTSSTYLKSITNSTQYMYRFEQQPVQVEKLQLPQRQQMSPAERKNLNRSTIETLIHSHQTNPSAPTYTCIAQIKYIDETQGWYYTACKICLKSLVEIGNTLICPKHQKRDPYLAFKLSLIVEDRTGTTTFVAFGSAAENLIDTNVDKPLMLEEVDRYTVPQFIKNQLTGKTFLFNVNAIKNRQYPEEISFRINTARMLEQQPAPSTLLLLPAPSSSGKLPETSTQKTLGQTTEEIPFDLFQEYTPTKNATESTYLPKKETEPREMHVPRKLKMESEGTELKNETIGETPKEKLKMKQQSSPDADGTGSKKFKQG